MTPKHFFDTNILLYSISTTPKELGKRQRAIALLEEEEGALSVQVLQEFYVQATRSTRTDPVTHSQAIKLITAWTRFPIQEVTMSIFEDALQIKEQFGFSYWDSAIIAAARNLGCKTLYSEDMSHGQRVSGVLIVNPFM